MEPAYTIASLLLFSISIVLLSKYIKKKERISNLIDLNEKEEHFKKIDKWLLLNKNYLQNNLRLSHIAKEVNLSEKQVSKSINTITGKNINAYINYLRVKEAKIMLMDKSFDKYTIDAIGEMAGFSNKVSFYRQFKLVTKVSPSDFRKINEAKTPSGS